MRAARLQANDLGRTDTFLNSLLSKEDIHVHEPAPLMPEPARGPHINGNSLPFRIDANPRFSDPPAPPPQQPLPEKPDVARSHAGDHQSSPIFLKRTTTERPRSVPSVSPVRQEPTSQIITLVEALASAKKEIDSQSARMRDLEEMLLKERQAREMAEDIAQRLELESNARTNGHTKSSVDDMEEAFEPPTDLSDVKEVQEIIDTPASESEVDPKAISESSLLLERRIEMMLVEIQELGKEMESFKNRAEVAELERDTSQKSLAEMVEKIRADDLIRRSSSVERGSTPPVEAALMERIAGSESKDLQTMLLDRIEKSNGHAVSSKEKEIISAAIETISKPQSNHDALLYHTTPYASMIGVVIIGMGLMAYLNGWQPPKVER